MSTDYDKYNNDGANFQAKCVLAALQARDLVDDSYCQTRRKIEAEPKVARWENCREQGYVIFLRSKRFEQINIAFFEHRNSDQIHAVMWEQVTTNSPNIQTAEFKDVYKDKYDTSFCVDYLEVDKMANWINEQLNAFWVREHK